ncbi:hypothetical protein B4U80_06195 [Leptotrombidium deliense]|uniref:Glycine cleavage system H protein n=1 Tax=Leptotrombidium deliense TaxID=299467 RepID=A0A443SS39_9ACAR|nr:hypothetical protein B4U80_06195 [Leptotrombidium deliense]
MCASIINNNNNENIATSAVRKPSKSKFEHHVFIERLDKVIDVYVLTELLDRVYSEKHEWAQIDGKIAKIGISDYAQEALGDVVFVQLPEVGQEVKQDEEIGTVESVKAASEVYTPLTGVVREINKKLEEKPGLINTACYTDGWLFTLEYTKSEELKHLMDEQQYQNYLKQNSAVLTYKLTYSSVVTIKNLLKSKIMRSTHLKD